MRKAENHRRLIRREMNKFEYERMTKEGKKERSKEAKLLFLP